MIIKVTLSVVTDFSKRLATFLDRPLFPWKKVIVGFSLAQYIFEGFLSLRQYQVLKQTRPPKALAGEVSQEVFDKSQVMKSFRVSQAL
jgi:STE24 endopeptidase